MTSALKPKVFVLQHSDGTPPGSVLEWAETRGFKAEVRRLHHGDLLPVLNDTDLLVILGGPMNVDDLDLHPWLRDEKAFLKETIARGIKCVGLCLGGQLLAQALGGRVEKNRHWEVGWHSVSVSAGAGARAGAAQKAELTVFQWHQDMFSLPSGATRLAWNDITPYQAFLFSDNVMGFQFHPEATSAWVQECADEDPYPSGPYVQTPKQVVEGLKHLPALTSWFFGELDRFLAV